MFDVQDARNSQQPACWPKRTMHSLASGPRECHFPAAEMRLQPGIARGVSHCIKKSFAVKIDISNENNMSSEETCKTWPAPVRRSTGASRRKGPNPHCVCRQRVCVSVDHDWQTSFRSQPPRGPNRTPNRQMSPWLADPRMWAVSRMETRPQLSAYAFPVPISLTRKILEARFW